MFPISSCEISLCKMYSIGIVSDCMSQKIIRSTPNRNNLFGRKMKSSLNYLFIRLKDVIVRKKTSRTSVAFKIGECDVHCNQYIAWLLEIYQSSSLKNCLFFISQKCCYRQPFEKGWKVYGSDDSSQDQGVATNEGCW